MWLFTIYSELECSVDGFRKARETHSRVGALPRLPWVERLVGWTTTLRAQSS